MHDTAWRTLITAEQLQSCLRSGRSLVIVDCRYELANADAGRVAYAAGHLPGAWYADLARDLSGEITAHSGRHPLPDSTRLSNTLRQWGITRDTQVVTYDASTGAMAAARLWWLLRWLGHAQVAVLDGGMQAWQAAGFALSTDSPEPHASDFNAEIQTQWVMGAEAVAEHAQQTSWCVLDARAPERYSGAIEPLDPVAGHVPGAKNHPFTLNLAADGKFLSAAILRQQFMHTLAGATHIVAMCGSGVTACHNLLALEIAGIAAAKLYVGSWSEWSRQGRLHATGPQS